MRNNTTLLTHSSGTEIVNHASVIRVEAISNYSKLYFDNGRTLVVAKVLKWFDEKLSNTNFIRIHRRHLVNGSAVVAVSGNSMQLSTQEWLAISKRKKAGCIHRLRSIVIT